MIARSLNNFVVGNVLKNKLKCREKNSMRMITENKFIKGLAD